MDSVRFGRALGMGARFAAKTARDAAEAALAPDPTRHAPQQTRPAPASAAQPAGAPPRTPRATPMPSGAALRRGGKSLGRSAWEPITRLSGVLWLEFTGVFFGLFALSALVGAWRLRDGLHASASNPAQHTHFLLTLGTALLFSYFCLSSFLRARRRAQRRA